MHINAKNDSIVQSCKHIKPKSTFPPNTIINLLVQNMKKHKTKLNKKKHGSYSFRRFYSIYGDKI